MKKILFIPILLAVIFWPATADAFTLERLKDVARFNLKDFMGDIGSDISDYVYSGNSEISLLQGNSIIASNKPIVPRYFSYFSKKKQVYIVTATAYSSTVDQTDSTPLITASGTHVRDGIVATNFLPFGTVIKIPDLYGNKTFVVEDRMNKRYKFNIDIWFATRLEAKEFGVKKIKIEVIS